MKIIFVCTGNTCRSPMAAGYLKSKNLPGITVESRGLCAGDEPANENAIAVMKEKGIDISEHISAPLTSLDIASAYQIICLSPDHYYHLTEKRVNPHKLMFFAGGVADPFGGDIAAYRKCRDQIFYSIDGMIKSGFFVPYEIKKAKTFTQLPPIATIEENCFSEPWSLEAIQDSFKAGMSFYIAERGRHVMGYFSISIILDEGYIGNLAVSPKYRKQGIATAFLEKIDLIAKEKALSFVSLEVRKSNELAISIYEKHGYIADGERKNFYKSPTEDALIMTKRYDKQK